MLKLEFFNTELRQASFYKMQAKKLIEHCGYSCFSPVRSFDEFNRYLNVIVEPNSQEAEILIKKLKNEIGWLKILS